MRTSDLVQNLGSTVDSTRSKMYWVRVSASLTTADRRVSSTQSAVLPRTITTRGRSPVITPALWGLPSNDQDEVVPAGRDQRNLGQQQGEGGPAGLEQLVPLGDG